ncbi:MAG: T9SS type A sorting domain-containing protein, partial [Flavobacteriales bacterium]
NDIKKSNAIFSTSDFDIDLAGMGKRLHLNTANLKSTIVGNFNVVPIDMVPGFQHTGEWYDFFGGNTVNVSDVNASMNFQPGEYHVYFDQPLFAPDTALNVAEAIELFGFNFMVYPNPASDRVTIGFRNTAAQRISIDLLDISGRVVEQIDNSNMGSGIQTIEWDSSHLTQGTYFVRIHSDQMNETHPLIISQ